MKKVVMLLFAFLLLLLAGICYAEEEMIIRENAVGCWHVKSIERLAELKKQGDSVKIAAYVTALFSERGEV